MLLCNKYCSYSEQVKILVVMTERTRLQKLILSE